MALEIFCIHSVYQLERLLLTISFPSVLEPRDRDSGAFVCHIDALRIVPERYRNAKVVNNLEVGFIYKTTVVRQENVDTGSWVVGIHNRVDSPDQDSRLFLVHWHDDDCLGSRVLVEGFLDPSRSSQRVVDQSINTNEPWYRKENSKGPKRKPLKKRDK